MDQMKDRRLVVLVKQYIVSRKPLMGICLGMQILFDGSEESVTIEGLHILPETVAMFNDATKSVPHIGWNNCRVSVGKPGSSELYNISSSKKSYFVHTCRDVLLPMKPCLYNIKIHPYKVYFCGILCSEHKEVHEIISRGT